MNSDLNPPPDVVDAPALGKYALVSGEKHGSPHKRISALSQTLKAPSMYSALWSAEDFRVIIGRTQIAYDQRKEMRNRRKHHYSLESAVDLLGGLVLPGTYRPFISRPIARNGEIRHEHITFDDSKNVVFFVTTMRDDETVRVISLRRAHENEIQLFIEHMHAMVHGAPNPPLDGLLRGEAVPRP